LIDDEASVVERDVLQFMTYDKGLVRGDLTYDIKNVLTLPLLKWTSVTEKEIK